MNGGLTRENSRKRALENGCIPNYNPRKVSGYRDFPPWCGRNAVQMDLQREEKSINAGGVVEAGDMKNSGRDNIMGANGVRNFEMANMVNAKGVKDREMANDVEADGVKSF
ncbi:histone H3 (Lys9) methyltransferase SUV39H1/Clr4 [Abeliophyllum distichum]|uniref:Histone H3 (Lys9) methyltransferase SUV39H1/Clr4 n=1 Tax=Abeliophyllum distichum TaxID=126358 RepID=A0ABD1T0U7_9LAMI